MFKKIISVLLLIVCLVAVGCKTQDKLSLVRVNEVTHSIFYAPFYAAINLGLFEKAGIKIELTNGGGSDKSMTALLSGQADIGFMGPETAVYVLNEGEKNHAVIIAQVTKRDGSFLVGKTPEPDFKWESLKGKKVIGGRKGGMPETTLEYVLRSKGIDPATDLTLRTDVSFDLMGGAFLGGSDDYVALFEPNASAMELAKQGYIVASVGEGTNEVAYTAMMITKSFRDNNRELVQKYVTALYQGQQWVKDNTPEKIAEIIAPSFPDNDKELVARVVARYKKIDAWKTEPALDEAAYNQMLDIIEQAGIIDKRPAYADISDNSFALNAIKQ